MMAVWHPPAALAATTLLLQTMLSSNSLSTMAFQASRTPITPPRTRPVLLTFSRNIRSRNTCLHMVFDFFKKAQTEASEQMAAFAKGLAKSRNQFLYNLEDSLSGDSKNFMDQLEDTLLQADLGTVTTDEVLQEARYLREESTKIFTRDDVKALLRGKLLEALGAQAVPQLEGSVATLRNPFTLQFATLQNGIPIREPSPNKIPTPLTIYFIMGANGMGKTTTIGKLAHRLRVEMEKKVLLAACDTFRAGAVAQLEQWAERANVDCFSPNQSSNSPSAVLFGALDKAVKENYDILLVDTSGRLSNNDALTAELVKMKRVIQKRMSTKFDEVIKPIPNEDVPHETLLVIDAAQGRMALDSAKQWDKEVGLTGLVLTKLDGSAKGGSVVAVSRELGLPVKLVGVGESIEDLKDFEPESFVDSLLGIGITGGASKGEGKALANRLNQMRKERSERANVTTKIIGSTTPSPISRANPDGQLFLNGLPNIMKHSMEDIVNDDHTERQVITPGGSNSGIKKKKKKGKR